MPNGKEIISQVTAPFTKHTPKKARFSGENIKEGISVSVYVVKGFDIPDVVEVTLTPKKEN